MLMGDKAHNIHLISLLEKQVHTQMINRVYGSDSDIPNTYELYKKQLTKILINIKKRKALNAGQTYQMAPVQQQQGTTATRSDDSPDRPSGVTPVFLTRYSLKKVLKL
jgi:hypothetical protein